MADFISLFKLLSDETRLRILMLLQEEPLCVCQLSGILAIPQPKISKGLSKLKDLNVVFDTRKEKFVWYALCENQPFLTYLLKEMKAQSSGSIFSKDLQRLSQKEVFLSCCSGSVK